MLIATNHGSACLTIVNLPPPAFVNARAEPKGLSHLLDLAEVPHMSKLEVQTSF